MSTPIFANPPSNNGSGYEADEQLEIGIINNDLVLKIVAQAMIDSGYSREEDGLEIADEKQLKAAAVQQMLDAHVVNSQKHLASKSATKFDLYAELLPKAPGVNTVPETIEEEIAQRTLMTKVWGYTNTGTSGFVQANIPDSGYVVCEAKVGRTKINQETGKREPVTEMARFLTADKDLIMTHFTGPAGAAFVRAARKLENMLGMVTERRPELAVPVARQLNVVVKQAVTMIPHADARNAAALTAGSSPALTAADADND